MLCVTNIVFAQRFFNLTADEVKIDTLLPRFNHSVQLTGNYQDSTYIVTIRYPEFINMSAKDIAAYDSITMGKPLPTMPEINSYVGVNRKQGTLDISFVPLVERNGHKQILVSFMLNIESKIKPKAIIKQQKKQEENINKRYKEHSVLSSGRWAKIRVPSTGIYQITDNLIKQAGFSNLSKVKIYGYGGNLQNEKLVADELIATDDLQELPTCIVENRRLFYAKGPVSWSSKEDPKRIRNYYSDYGYYFIIQTDEEPLLIDENKFKNDVYPAVEDYHSLREIDNYSWYHGGRNLFENDPISSGESKSYDLSVPQNNNKGVIYVNLSGEKTAQATIALNDSVLGNISLVTGSDLQKANVRGQSFEVVNLKENNKIQISSKGGVVRLDYISIVFDTPRAFPELSSSSFPVPEYVHNITNQDLHGHQQADMVIIIPTSQKIRSQAERLASFHELHDGMRINIVPADELYNEFSSGTPDANAYRRYLKMLYDRASTESDMPKYLLLFGDGAYDNRMLSSDWRTLSVDDFLLCYESENSVNEYSCYVNDSWFGLLDDGEGINPTNGDKIDIGVGRFPVRSEEEANIMTDKTINYITNNNRGDWQNVIMLMGDDDPKPRIVNNHMVDADDIAESVMALHPAYMVKKVMWDAYTRESSSTGNRYPDVENIVKQQQKNGALIMNYSGHGSPTSMSHERVLVLDDFQNFQNENLPLWVINACDIMPFDANMGTIGEAAVLNKKGGAVAVYSTTRTVFRDHNKSMNSAFMKNVLSIDDSGKPMRLGDAVRLSKNSVSSTDENCIHYHLLGDPALSLNIPTYDIIIDSINGVAINGTDEAANTFPKLSAGTIANVVGHIEYKGEIDATFNGSMMATVRDTKERIVCKKNHPEQTSAPFSFVDRTKTLYTGADNVVNGKFNFSFAVPLDINYADDAGQIIIHATSDTTTHIAHGMTENIIVGGTGEIANDSIGPSIYCYLNSPSFVDGGDVNSTPYFVAEISDSDGINASGIGLGHNMELIIDGEMSRTYSLNDNFRFEFGSYTKGTTYYFIPELNEGRHKLQFRAWDVKNNSSTATLSFNVVKGLQPTLFNVDCTNNPASTNTTFIVTHDRTGSNVDVDLEIFDTSGRLLWRHTESGIITDETYTINWDLTIDGGQRLQTGVYLYRVLIGSDNSKKASKAKKLIVISNN